MANQEKERTQRIFNQVILGNNRKRKRGEIELDDMDELSKRKQERINQLIDSDESDGDGFGFEEQMKKKQLIEDMKEDDMSDEEIQKTLENQDFFQFKKEMNKVGEKTFMRRFANIKDKNAEEDAAVEMMMEDLDKAPSRAQTPGIDNTSKASHFSIPEKKELQKQQSTMISASMPL